MPQPQAQEASLAWQTAASRSLCLEHTHCWGKRDAISGQAASPVSVLLMASHNTAVVVALFSDAFPAQEVALIVILLRNVALGGNSE